MQSFKKCTCFLVGPSVPWTQYLQTGLLYCAVSILKLLALQTIGERCGHELCFYETIEFVPGCQMFFIWMDMDSDKVLPSTSNWNLDLMGWKGNLFDCQGGVGNLLEIGDEARGGEKQKEKTRNCENKSDIEGCDH
jgi:hypothetical protein